MTKAELELREKNLQRRKEDTVKRQENQELNFGKLCYRLFETMDEERQRAFEDANIFEETDLKDLKQQMVDLREIFQVAERIEEGLAELNAIAVCPNCGNPVSEDDMFCAECGNKIIQEESICPQCGKPRQDGAAFCMNCGFKFEDGGKGQAEPVAHRCSNCQTELEEGVRFCPVCGTRQG